MKIKNTKLLSIGSLAKSLFTVRGIIEIGPTDEAKNMLTTYEGEIVSYSDYLILCNRMIMRALNNDIISYEQASWYMQKVKDFKETKLGWEWLLGCLSFHGRGERTKLTLVK